MEPRGFHMIVGDPIEQVKSPAGMTRAFARAGINAVLVPVQVSAADLGTALVGADKIANLDGIVVTLPHKFDCFAHCASTSDRSKRLGAVNVMRRRQDGRWDGDMLDGAGFVAAAWRKGVAFAGNKAELVGAGGAGSAIALALLEAGVASLHVYDSEKARAATLVSRLEGIGRSAVIQGVPDQPFEVLVNASPAGMRDFPSFPWDLHSFFRFHLSDALALEDLMLAFLSGGRRTG
jgi:shikimate dehydrogenase